MKPYWLEEIKHQGLVSNRYALRFCYCCHKTEWRTFSLLSSRPGCLQRVSLDVHRIQECSGLWSNWRVSLQFWSSLKEILRQGRKFWLLSFNHSGKADDAAAINKAVSYQREHLSKVDSSTTSPAVVYFPVSFLARLLLERTSSCTTNARSAISPSGWNLLGVNSNHIIIQHQSDWKRQWSTYPPGCP